MYNHPFDTKNDPYQVLNHGDIWVNNIMFKSDGKKPVDILFVSYSSLAFLLNNLIIYAPLSFTD